MNYTLTNNVQCDECGAPAGEMYVFPYEVLPGVVEQRPDLQRVHPTRMAPDVNAPSDVFVRRAVADTTNPQQS